MSNEKVNSYCFKCKAKEDMKDIEPYVNKRGMLCWKGKCSKCETGMFKIRGKAENGKKES